MTSRSVFILLVIFTTCYARIFNNPVIGDLDTPDPGVVFYNGLYYAVTTTNNDSPQKYPIHVSEDLQNWRLVSYVFNGANNPVWSTGVEYWAPDIQVLSDGQFRVYFTTRDRGSDRLVIGAAYASNILGPYHPLDRPLVLDPSQNVLDATLLKDGNSLYLIWKGAEWMYGRALQSDGLTFTNDPTHLVMKDSLPWEAGIIGGPFVIKRDNTFFLFYTGNNFCGDVYSVGVAKSTKPLGPYEKRGDPILVSSDSLKGPGGCSVVKDVDGTSDVILFHAYRSGQVCEAFPRLMCAQSLSWAIDGWPIPS